MWVGQGAPAGSRLLIAHGVTTIASGAGASRPDRPSAENEPADASQQNGRLAIVCHTRDVATTPDHPAPVPCGWQVYPQRASAPQIRSTSSRRSAGDVASTVAVSAQVGTPSRVMCPAGLAGEALGLWRGGRLGRRWSGVV